MVTLATSDRQVECALDYFLKKVCSLIYLSSLGQERWTLESHDVTDIYIPVSQVYATGSDIFEVAFFGNWNRPGEN